MSHKVKDASLKDLKVKRFLHYRQPSHLCFLVLLLCAFKSHSTVQPVEIPRSLTVNLQSKAFGAPFNMLNDSLSLVESLSSNNGKGLEIKHFVIREANHEFAFPTALAQGLNWLFSKDNA